MTVNVAPYMGAWIETCHTPGPSAGRVSSLPIWERGLKLCSILMLLYTPAVAPYMGAWIETCTGELLYKILWVAPYMGAWIETVSGQWRWKLSDGRSLYGSVD